MTMLRVAEAGGDCAEQSRLECEADDPRCKLAVVLDTEGCADMDRYGNEDDKDLFGDESREAGDDIDEDDVDVDAVAEEVSRVDDGSICRCDHGRFPYSMTRPYRFCIPETTHHLPHQIQKVADERGGSKEVW
jgi:hypothetical protein